MKYSIQIEGGFTGIPMHYEGEVRMDPEKADALFHAMSQETRPEEYPWPDTLQYSFEFVQGSLTKRAQFNEKELPASLREFLDTIRNQTRR